MRNATVRTAVVAGILNLLVAASAAAQVMDKVDYFPDSIAEKDDHVVRLNGGSSWLLANPSKTAQIAADVMIVMRDVVVEGKPVRAAWVYVGGEEIPVKHLEGVYPTNSAFLTRVVAAEDRGTKLRLADGTELLLPGYNSYISNRWIPPYKALLGGNRDFLYNLREGRRVGVQAAKR
jgi:hypothetical protein